MGFFNPGCFKQTIVLAALFCAALCGLSWLLLWIYNGVEDQYPTGFMAGWICFFGMLWSLVLFRHARENIDDRGPIGMLFTGIFGCYFVVCAVLFLCIFIALVSLDAGGTSIWALLTFIVIVALIVIWCQKESARASEGDFFDEDDGPCSTFVVQIVLAVLCFIALFFHITMAAQALGAARDQASITPPGKIVQAADIDGVFSDMHIYCLDNDDDDYDVSGLPLVLLESALNAPGSVAWANVQQPLARVVRVCSYDRRGYGWSWRGPNPRHVSRFADELNELLSLAQERRSIVMVGWGYGGMAAMSYAHQYPAQVKGAVFVDALHPEAATVESSADSQTVSVSVEDEFSVDAGVSSYDNFVRFFAPLGFIRMGESSSVETGSLGFPLDTLRLLPDRAFEAYRAFLLGYYHPNVVVQEKREWTRLSYDDVLRADNSKVLRDCPAAKSGVKDCTNCCNLYDVLDTPVSELPIGVVSAAGGSDNYVDLQKKIAALSNDSIHVTSKEEAFLPMTDPDLLVSTIIQVTARAAVVAGVRLDALAGRRRALSTPIDQETEIELLTDHLMRRWNHVKK